MSYELGRREVCFDHPPMHALGGWEKVKLKCLRPLLSPPLPSWLVNEPQAGFRVHPPWVSPSLCRALVFTSALYVSVAFVSIMASPAELQQTIIAFVKKGLYADALARTNERTWPWPCQHFVAQARPARLPCLVRCQRLLVCLFGGCEWFLPTCFALFRLADRGTRERAVL